MRKHARKLLSAMVLAYLGLPAWAEAPVEAPLPAPTPLGAPSEDISPPPPSPPPPNLNSISQAPETPIVVNQSPDCDCNKRHGYWTIGGGVYYIQPVFETNPAFLTTRSAGGTTVVNQTDFSQGMDVAPLGFIGYTGSNGLGVRFRWFQFDGSGSAGATFTDATFVADPGGLGGALVPAGTVVDGISNLTVDVYDLEATYVFHCGNWSLLTSAGARYAHMSQDYALSVTDPTGTAIVGLAASHNFNGAGPTFSLQGQHQCGDTCFSLYGSARASILFGSAHQVSSFVAPGTAPVLATSRQTDVLPIGEIEIGGQWGKIWKSYRVFAQLGFVGQVWLGGGNASQGLSTAGLGGGGFGTASDNGTNFGFFGGVARAGINF